MTTKPLTLPALRDMILHATGRKLQELADEEQENDQQITLHIGELGIPLTTDNFAVTADGNLELELPDGLPGDLEDAIDESANSALDLFKVKRAIADYHLALDRREHGGVAGAKALDEVQAALGMTWEPGEMRRRVNERPETTP